METESETEVNMEYLDLLFNEENAFHPKVEAILQEIFNRFDKDGDGIWSMKDLQAFAVATNGREFDEFTIDEIQETFCYGDKEQLTFQGFCDLYHTQTASDPEETIKDFKKHGYDHNLELVTSRRQDEIPKTPITADDE